MTHAALTATIPALPADCRPIIDRGDPRVTIEGYGVRADGVVLGWHRRRKKWLPLAVKVGAHGFRKVHIGPRHAGRERGVAALVLRAWVGPRPLGCEPLHYPDPDPGNNRLENLRWAPRGTSKTGRQLGPTPPQVALGDRHYHARLRAADIPEIRQLYRAGVSAAEIAEKYDVTSGTIDNVLHGRTWAHVPDPDGPVQVRRQGTTSAECPLAVLDWERVAEIRRRLAAGEHTRAIAADFGVSNCCVRDIAFGRTWKSPPDLFD